MRLLRSSRPFCAAALLAALAVTSHASTLGEAPKISSIHFQGNDHQSERQLLGQMRLHPPRWWLPLLHSRYTGADFLASDLKAVLLRYQAVGFPLARIDEAVVTYNEKGDKVDLLIRVDEGPAIRLGRIFVRGVFPGWTRELTDRMALRQGEPLSWPSLLSERDRINAFLSDRGHPLASTGIEARYGATDAEVLYSIHPGDQIRVGTIKVEGLRHSKERMVLRELVLAPGDVLTGPRVLKSQERLLGSGVFHRARLLPSFPDSTQPVANLTVDVEERKHAWYSLGGGYSSGDQLRLAGDWGLSNLTGMGRRLSVNGSLYYSLGQERGLTFHEGLTQVEYTEPWLLGTRTRGIVAPYVHWLHEKSLIERTIGYNLTLRKDLAQAARISLSLETKHVSTSDTTSSSSSSPQSKFTTRLLNLNYTDDRRDNVLDPARGTLAQVAVENAGGFLQGTYSFSRFTAAWQAYTSSRKRWVLAFRMRAGQIVPVPFSWSEPDTMSLHRIPWDERFRTGGGSSIRGYREGQVGRIDSRGLATGGLTMLATSLELRFPLVWIIQLGAFLDAGNVWAKPSELSLARFYHGFYDRNYDPKNVAYGAGAGIRFMTPVGPFRLDYGFKLGSARAPGQSRRELHVALGQAF